MMSYDMANSISKRTTQAVIGAMNVNWSLPRVLAFAGTKLLGLGLHHHYKMIFEYSQLLAGVQYPILQHPKPHLPHITNPMITTIRQFLAESQLNIVILGIYSPQPLWENDYNIMGELMKIEKSTITIQQVNQCRLFLQVTWISKMSNKLGMTITPDFLEYTGTQTTTSRSTLKWPIQGLPPKKSWEIWKKLIHKRFLLSKLSRLGTATLETPLGPFIRTHDNHQVWNWEQTGPTTVVENTYLFNNHQQVHYNTQLTRHQIKVNQNDKLHTAQPIIHGHPIMMRQSTNNTWTFAQPLYTPNDYNTYEPKQTVLRDVYKTEMLKLVQYRPMSIPDTQAI
jgi:hypothetical protein